MGLAGIVAIMMQATNSLEKKQVLTYTSLCETYMSFIIVDKCAIVMQVYYLLVGTRCVMHTTLLNIFAYISECTRFQYKRNVRFGMVMFSHSACKMRAVGPA